MPSEARRRGIFVVRIRRSRVGAGKVQRIMKAWTDRLPFWRALPGGGRPPVWRWVVAAGLLLPAVTPAAPAPVSAVVPAPAQLTLLDGQERLTIGPDCRVALHGHIDGRLAAAVARVSRRWEERTGYTFPREETLAPADPTLVIDCEGPAPDWPQPNEDESYTLEVTATQAVLRAPTPTGALRGLETWSQLLTSDGSEWFVPLLTVRDAPRFNWRALAIDITRRWQPLEVIKRQIDGMALVKLNVLQLQLSGDHGFRIQSHVRPRLHVYGSEGRYYTHRDIRELVAYAAARGIRIVPHFPLPGAATGWLVGYPDLGSGAEAYQLVRGWHAPGAALDPTSELVYAALEDVLAEMAALFPDPFVHVGGGSAVGAWASNERFAAYAREQGLETPGDLHALFLDRLAGILGRHGKRLVVDDAVWRPDLPRHVLVEVAGPTAGMQDIVRAGFAVLKSRGFGLDAVQSAAELYHNDPLPIGAAFSGEERRQVLGGVARLDGAWVSAETVDSWIWPRAAAVAERWWSAPQRADSQDLHHRLPALSRRLEEAGLRHKTARKRLLRLLAGDRATEAELGMLQAVVEVLRPAGPEVRSEVMPDATRFTPVGGLADSVVPESAAARDFAEDLRRLLAREIASGAADRLRAQLIRWQAAARELEQGLARRSPRIAELVPLFQVLQESCSLGLAAIEAVEANQPLPSGEEARPRGVLERVAAPHGMVEIAVAPALRTLVETARRSPAAVVEDGAEPMSADSGGAAASAE